jgi:[ribosomal protein S5]-alanine N-acetyltransferase
LVAPQFRRRRYATAALDAISRWGLSLEGIHRVELYVEPWNEGSWRAAERVGYLREGRLRSWQRVGQERRDMYMYSLLPQDLARG